MRSCLFILFLGLFGSVSGEDLQSVEVWRELLADYAQAGEVPPSVLTEALREPPPGILARQSPAAERWYQARECLAALPVVARTEGLLDADQQTAVSAWCRTTAKRIIGDLLADYPGPATIPPDVIHRRPQLGAVAGLVRMHRQRVSWSSDEHSEGTTPWPLRDEARRLQTGLAAMAMEMVLHPTKDASKREDALDQALWLIEDLGGWLPMHVADDPELSAAAQPLVDAPMHRALAMVATLQAQPQRGRLDQDVYAQERQTAEAARSLIARVARAAAQAQQLAGAGALPDPNWAQASAQIQARLSSTRVEVLAALGRGQKRELGAVKAEINEAIEIGYHLDGIVSTDRSLIARIRDQIAQGPVSVEDQDRLTTLLADWRQQQTIVLTTVTQAAALRRAAALARSGIEWQQHSAAELEQAEQQLQHALTSLEKPPRAPASTADDF